MGQELEHRFDATERDEESDEDEEEEEEEEDDDDDDEEEESGEEESEEEESGDEEESEEEESGDEFEDEDGEGRVKKLVKKYDSGVKNTPKPAPSDDEEEEESGDEEEESDEEEDDDEEDEDESDGDEKAGDEEKGLFSDEHGDDAPKDADADAMQKRKRLHGIICCCCCLIIILAIVLGVVLGGKDKDDEDAKKPSPKPTPAPTTLPPTSAPTLHPVQIFFPVIADTFVRNGEFANETFGTDDTLLVRGGGNVSDAYIILEFDLTNLPPDTNIFRESEVLLQLTHVESITNFTDSIVISRLPYDLAIDVDTLTWEDFSPEGALAGPSFTVQGDTETVTVDITGLIRETTQLRKGRRLQIGKILLMLASADSENVYGEVFRSMEGGNETAPLIIHNFNTDSPTAAPSASKMPSLAPSMSAAPTLSSAPSVSRPPSSAPSLSAAPSTSTQPTAAPTKSAAPTGAPSPSPSANTNATSTTPSIGPSSNAVPSTVGPTPVVPQTSSSPVASAGTP